MKDRNIIGRVINFRVLSGLGLLATLVTYAGLTSAEVSATQNPRDFATQIRDFIAVNMVVPPQTELELGLEALRGLPQSSCAIPLEIKSYAPMAGPSNLNLVLTCRQTPPWRAMLPVTVKAYAPIVVANRSLTPGHTLTNDDTRLIKMDISLLHQGYFAESARVTGSVVKRVISAGMPVYAHQLKPPLLVKRGDRVTLRSENHQFAIRMIGEALKDGALGETIPVRNLSSKRVVKGVVTRAQEVSIPL